MDEAIVADSAMDAVDAIEEQVCLQVDCTPDLDNDLDVLSLEVDSPSVVAVTAFETAATVHGPSYSEVQLSHIKEINDHLSATILVGSVHPSAKELKELINAYGSKKGFQVSISSNTLKCQLAGDPKRNEKWREIAATVIPVEKRRSRSSPRCGCGFIVKYSAIKTASVTENVNGSKVTKQIKVTAVNFNHSNGCTPSAPQLLLVNKMSGLYTRNVDWTRLFHLLSYQKSITPAFMRLEIQQLLPCGVAVDSDMLYNVKLKHKRMMADGFNFATATNVSFDPEALSNNDTDMLDLGSKHAAELLKEAMSEGNDGAQVEKFLRSLKTMDPRFDYRIAKDKFGATGSPRTSLELRAVIVGKHLS
jgi:hypothetical protein